MRPIFVFEGAAPELKRQQLAHRAGRREEAVVGLAAAKEADDQASVEKYSKRTVRVSWKEHISRSFSWACDAKDHRLLLIHSGDVDGG